MPLGSCPFSFVVLFPLHAQLNATHVVSTDEVACASTFPLGVTICCLLSAVCCLGKLDYRALINKWNSNFFIVDSRRALHPHLRVLGGKTYLESRFWNHGRDVSCVVLVFQSMAAVLFGADHSLPCPALPRAVLCASLARLSL